MSCIAAKNAKRFQFSLKVNRSDRLGYYCIKVFSKLCGPVSSQKRILLIVLLMIVNVLSSQIDLPVDYIHYSFIKSCSLQNENLSQHHALISGLLNFDEYSSDLQEKELTLSYGYGRFGEASFSYDNTRRFVNFYQKTSVCRYRYGNYIDLLGNSCFFHPIGIINFDFYHYFNPNASGDQVGTQFLNYRDLTLGGGLKIGKPGRWGVLANFSFLASRLAAYKHTRDPICDKNELQITGATAIKILDHIWFDGIAMLILGDSYCKLIDRYDGTPDKLVTIRSRYTTYNSFRQSYTITIWNAFFTAGFKSIDPQIDPWKEVELFEHKEFNVSVGYTFKHNRIRIGYKYSNPYWAGNIISCDYELML